MNRKSNLSLIFGIVVLCLALCVGPVWAQSEYVVIKGDSLSSISKKIYGTSSKWNVIYEANKDIIQTPDSIRIGSKLKIPLPEKEVPKEEKQPADSTQTSSKPQVSQAEHAENEVSKEAKFTFLYFNDSHGSLEPEVKKGKPIIVDGKETEQKYEVAGIARMAGMVRMVQKDNRDKDIPTFLVNSGDFLQGTLLSNHFLGQIEAEIYNKIGLSFYAFGNHELDFGIDNLLKLTESIKAKCVTSNFKVRGKYIGHPEIIKSKGVKVGIGGLLTRDDFNIEISKIDPAFLKDIVVEDEAEKAEKIYYNLKDKGADVIVLLTHLGFDKDKRIAQNMKGIDIIIGGDSHTKIDSYEKIGNTYIVQAESYGRYLGRMDITVKDGKLASFDSKLISLDENVKPDDEISKIVEKKRAELEKRFNQKIAETDCVLEGDKSTIRNRETNLGNLITDILKDRFKTDIAIFNSGGIRSSIAKGNMTMGDIHKVMPFVTNKLHILTISGKELLAVLNHNANHKGEGGFLQVSGLKFEIKPHIGVRNVMVNGQRVDEGKMYKMVTSSFVATGGDGYKMLESIPNDRRSKEEFNIAQIVIDHINENYGKTGKHVSYCNSEDRIVISE